VLPAYVSAVTPWWTGSPSPPMKKLWRLLHQVFFIKTGTGIGYPIPVPNLERQSTDGKLLFLNVCWFHRYVGMFGRVFVERRAVATRWRHGSFRRTTSGWSVESVQRCSCTVQYSFARGRLRRMAGVAATSHHRLCYCRNLSHRTRYIAGRLLYPQTSVTGQQRWVTSQLLM